MGKTGQVGASGRWVPRARTPGRDGNFEYRCDATARRRRSALAHAADEMDAVQGAHRAATRKRPNRTRWELRQKHVQWMNGEPGRPEISESLAPKAAKLKLKTVPDGIRRVG